MVIAGTSLGGATKVTFGGVDAYEFTVKSDTEIEATVPNGYGTVDVVVVTPNGTATKPDGFTYSA